MYSVAKCREDVGGSTPGECWHRLPTFKMPVYRLCLFSQRFPWDGSHIFICRNKSLWQLMWPSGVGGNNHRRRRSLEDHHNQSSGKREGNSLKVADEWRGDSIAPPRCTTTGTHTSGERLAQGKEDGKAALGMEQQPEGQTCCWDDQGDITSGSGREAGRGSGNLSFLTISGDRGTCLPCGPAAFVRQHG